MIRLRIQFSGVGTYPLNGTDGINQAIFLDMYDNIVSQSGSVFIYSNTGGKISGVFNFRGQSNFPVRTVTVNKGNFISISLQQ